MALIACPNCNSEDINGTPQADSRLLIHCNDCGHEWLRGEARRDPSRPAVQTFDSLHASFPTPPPSAPTSASGSTRSRPSSCWTAASPTPTSRSSATATRSSSAARAWPPRRRRTSTSSPTPTPSPTPATCPASTGRGRPRARTRRAQKVRETIEFLLHGPESLRLEDRLTQLIDGKKVGFPSFNKEPLLTKVLCVVEPERFLPVLKYSAPTDGKKEIAKLVFDLDLPPAEKVAWTIGRLVVWSNDLLRSLVGNDIPDLQHATQFLGWAKTRPALSRD